jgi:predicted RNA-binding protein with PUA-like domain
LADLVSLLLAREKRRKGIHYQARNLLRKGSRLSIQPVTPAEWSIILRLGKKKRGGADS